MKTVILFLVMIVGMVGFWGDHPNGGEVQGADSITEGKKTLYLVRHAKSSHKDKTLADFDRPLNGRGKLDAPMMGKILNDRNPGIERMVASPALRTLTTAEMIAAELGYANEDIVHEKELYRCPESTMLDLIKGMDNDINTLMVVGHNPAITGCANYLQADTTIEEVKTTGIVVLEFDVEDWADISKENSKLTYADRPKNHADNGKKKKKK